MSSENGTSRHNFHDEALVNRQELSLVITHEQQGDVVRFNYQNSPPSFPDVFVVTALRQGALKEDIVEGLNSILRILEALPAGPVDFTQLTHQDVDEAFWKALTSLLPTSAFS